ncbi:CBN-CLEC-50 protein, partial [Aphelenchoides avenae]
VCEMPQVADSRSPTPAPPRSTPRCPSKWAFLNSTRKCYKAVHDTYTLWIEAEQHCVGEGARLVSVHSPEEQQFISEIAGTGVPMLCWDAGGKQAGGPSVCDNGVWIGLNDYKDVGVYKWSDGSTYDYENWKERPGQHESPSGVAYYADAFTYGPYGPWSRFWQADGATTKMRAFVCNKNPL